MLSSVNDVAIAPSQVSTKQNRRVTLSLTLPLAHTNSNGRLSRINRATVTLRVHCLVKFTGQAQKQKAGSLL